MSFRSFHRVGIAGRIGGFRFRPVLQAEIRVLDLPQHLRHLNEDLLGVSPEGRFEGKPIGNQAVGFKRKTRGKLYKGSTHLGVPPN